MTQTAGEMSIFDVLAQLNARLLQRVDDMRAQTGREPGADPFRGLYISDTDVVGYLEGRESPAVPNENAAPLAAGASFDALREKFGLSQFELDVLLIALSPDIDRRYERVFAYLQDDVSRKRPSVDLVLDLLSCATIDKFARAAFGASAPLVRHNLIRLLGDDWTPLRREVCVEPRVAAFLLGDNNLDSRLSEFATLMHPAAAAACAGRVPADSGLVEIVRSEEIHESSVIFYFRGTDGQTKKVAAAALARELNRPLLTFDLLHASQRLNELDDLLRNLAREALLQTAIIYHEHWDSLPDDTARDSVLRMFPAGTLAICSGIHEWKSHASNTNSIITVSFETPDWQERRNAWASALGERKLCPPEETLDDLAECFRFTNTQIVDAASLGIRLATYRRQRTNIGHVFEAARLRSGDNLGNLARKVSAIHGWDDIVLPEDSLDQLREICRRITLRHHVMDNWGFARKLSSGKGVNALFVGPSGTGKTMAAEVIARELHLDLYKIDLSGVVSKYIGETEKNLERIFSAAENANVILLFDEADALFGKRSEVRDSHDRYANVEISYLLQRMEQYEGVSILATNLWQNLDHAFIRRLAFTVHFPFPDEVSRARIWDGIWPKQTPLNQDIDHAWLGSRFLLSGGNIRNAAVAAAYLAAHESTPVSMRHILCAIKSEFLKMGKTLTTAELAVPECGATGVEA